MASRINQNARNLWVAGLTLLTAGALYWISVTPTPSKPSAQAYRPSEVMIYLHDGTDKTGTLTHLGKDGYTLQTPSGPVTVERKLYQGMVLNTPEEKAVSEKIARDFMLYLASGQYSFALKKEILAKIQLPKKNCSMKSLPVVHFHVMPDGAIKNQQLLLASGCPETDAAIMKAVESVKPIPLSKDYTPPFFPMNYVYDPDAPKETEKSPKK